MNSKIKNRIIKSFGAIFLGKMSALLFQIISISLYVNNWGATLYGEWLILSTIPSYLSMSCDFGFGTVASNEMAMKVGEKKKKDALIVFQSVWVLITLISLLLIIIGLIIFYFIPIKEIFNIEIISENSVTAILVLFLMRLLLFQQEVLLISGFRCEGYYAESVFTSNCFKLLEYISIIILLIAKYNPIAIAAVSVFFQFGSVIFLRLLIKKYVSWLSYGFKYVSLTKIKQLFPAAIAYMAFPISNALNIQGIVTIVGWVLGSEAVVVFTTTRTMINSLKQLLNLVNASIWPEISTNYGSGNIAVARRLHSYSVKISLYFSIVGMFILGFLGKYIYMYWLGSALNFNQILFYGLLIQMTLTTLWFSSSIVHIATNKHNILACLSLVGAFITFVIAFYLLKHWGLEVLPLSLIVTDILLIIYVIPKSLKILDDTYSNFLKTIIFNK